ncbi:MAG TPA: hypothetical protein VFB07_00375 [Vicinamibacterales bacterium]|nr:hypothetical protein [Vicinamibacterales bacterium]
MRDAARPAEHPRNARSGSCSAGCARAACAVVLVAAAGLACGKKGPPLPPLVRLPAPPANIVAQRRGDTVDVSFTVPDTNTDRTRPANVERIDVYAITAPPTISDEQLLKRATKIGSVAVKSPKDPNAVVDEDERDEEVEPAVGTGLDQGATAHVEESLTRQAFAPADLGKPDREARRADAEAGRPLIGPLPSAPARTYVAVGVSTRGRKGPLSKRVTAPLIDPPPTPRDVHMVYTEKAVDLSWSPAAAPTSGPNAVLPSRPLGSAAPTIAYNVYDVSTDTPQKINKDPLDEPTLADPRMEWGEKRCYAIRAVAIVAGASVESSPTPAVCETLTDTFAPAPPKGLRSVPGEKTISLIWDPNGESDLGGYLVFRATSGGPLEQVTPKPIRETTFSDSVEPGVRYTYALKAIDRAGNPSAFSDRVDETARE